MLAKTFFLQHKLEAISKVVNKEPAIENRYYEDP